MGSASAGVYIPTKLTDSADGACDADCSLREAILAANASGHADEIWLPAGVFTLTIPGSGETAGATGDLNISDDLELIGQGPEATIIDATGLGDRVLHVQASGAQVRLEALTVTGGSTSASGGGIYHAAGHLVLSNVVVRDNQSADGGGGVHSYLAELTVQDGSVIKDNSAGAASCGGGLTGNDLTVTDSTVWGNQAACGGGINTGGLTVSGSTIAYNTSLGYDGGGIMAEGAQVEISNTTLVGNYSGRNGGAIQASLGTTVSLNAVTLSGNSSLTGEILRASDATITFINTLISGSCYTSGSGTFLTSGGNMESPGDTCDLAAGTDQIGVGDPMLYPLDSYGGPTQTMLPRLGSPALGGGDDGYCLTYDQRGELRGDGNCDVGAVERQSVEDEPIFVDGFESGDTSAW